MCVCAVSMRAEHPAAVSVAGIQAAPSLDAVRLFTKVLQGYSVLMYACWTPEKGTWEMRRQNDELAGG